MSSKVWKKHLTRFRCGIKRKKTRKFHFCNTNKNTWSSSKI